MKNRYKIGFILLAAISVVSCNSDDLIEVDGTNAYAIDNNTNYNEQFLTDWEHVQVVKINTSNNIDSTATPWNNDASISVLPDEICTDVKKADGWEMVFCCLGNPTVQDANYFALYNKYIGTMRVFCYINDASGIGSEASFGVKLGSTDFKTPFYHTLAYGIPTSHKDINTRLNMAGSTADSFYAYYSPYTITGNHVPTRGWCAFDIDMSAYNSDPDKFLENSNERINLFCSTVNKSDVRLSGTLDASIKGQYSSAEVAQNASSGSGVGSTLSMLGELLSDVQTSALANIQAVITGCPWNLYSYYAGSVCKGAAMVANYIDSNPYHTKDIEEMPGKIDMNLTGTIDLSGYTTSLVPNNIPALKLGASMMKQSGSHFASGVWSLENDPVIYIAGNKFMGNGRRINFVVGDNNEYNSAQLDYDELRMMTFFDPTSIKVNLNPNVFHNIKKVTVEAYYGVFPDEEPGSTLMYQALMKMDERGRVNIVDHEKIHKGDIYNSAAPVNAMNYVQYAKENFIDNDATDEEKATYNTVQQAGSNYKYYGRVLSGAGGKGKRYILEPQIFFPLSSDNNSIYDGIIPDLVVTVCVTVEADGNLYTYNRNFVPEVRVVKDASDLTPVRDNLTRYINAAKTGGSSIFIYNLPSIPMKFSEGEKKFQKTIDLINIIAQ